MAGLVHEHPLQSRSNNSERPEQSGLFYLDAGTEPGFEAG
jgi:hypothetical protein